LREDKSSIALLIIIVVVLCYFVFFRADVFDITYNPDDSEKTDNNFSDILNLNNDLYSNYNNDISNENTIGKYNNNIDNVIQENDSSSYKKFYYSQLNDIQKNIYLKIEKGCQNHQKSIKLDKVGREDMTIASYAISMDHPEFFWTRKYSFDIINDEYVTNIYYEIPDDVDMLVSSIDSKVNSIFEEIVSQNIENNYDKIKFFYEWIINNTEYGERSDSQEITSVFVNNTSVCAGYSKAFLYLCQKADIECAYVSGYTNQNEKHAWNLVKLGDNYYWIDVTWGDPVYAGEKDNRINYNYFLVDDSDFFTNHIIERGVESSWDYNINKTFEFPNCTDDSLSYYKSNGSYFNTYDSFLISSYIKDKFRNGIYQNIELKFNDSEQYNSFLYEFIEKDNARIYEDVKAVNPMFYGTISISYETIESANYVKISIDLVKM